MVGLTWMPGPTIRPFPVFEPDQLRSRPATETVRRRGDAPSGRAGKRTQPLPSVREAQDRSEP